eukprot:COSAG01_NODE_62663_length_283_cov_1.217391_1_plen_26_part_10
MTAHICIQCDAQLTIENRGSAAVSVG